MSQNSLPDKKIKAEKKKPRPPRRITETYLHNAGLYYLQRYASSAAHFRTVMTRKIDRSCKHHKEQDRADCIALLDKLIERFIEVGLLNDDAYTSGMVNSMRRRGLSSRMIHAKLRTKGLHAAAIEQALQNHDDDCDSDAELSAALKHARRKKIGPFARQDQDEEAKQKALAAMARAGFSYDLSRRVLDMESSEIDD